MSVAARSLILCTAVLLALLFCGACAQGPAMAPSALGPASAPPPGPDCGDALLNLSSCLTYVEAGSNVTKPDEGCCPALADLIKTQPVCLCQLVGSNEAYGITINTTRALKLPTVCHVQTPPVSLCSVLGVPVPSSPVPSPMSSPVPSPMSSAIFHTPGSAPNSLLPSSGSRVVATSLVLFIGLGCGIAIF